MATRPVEEQQFDFGVAAVSETDPAAQPAEGLVARVEAVRAAATRRAARRHRGQPQAWMEVLYTEESAAETPPEAPVVEPAVEEDEQLGADELESPLPDEESLSVAQFYRRVRHALESEFSYEVWVIGEIRGLRVRGGHRYIELADHGAESSGRGAQQLEVTCWARDWPRVANALDEAGVELEVGRVVRVRGRVSVWEGGGRLRFTLTMLDVEALLGSIAAARRQLLRALQAEGLIEANRLLPVPLVPLRIGLVTSKDSEAHHDFVGQLNRSGYAFEIHLEPSLVQGADAPGQLAAALKRLERFMPDLAVIVRGGGARGDLAAFDSELVARAIATAPFPVWCGVGHTGDRSVADEVANFSTITPTACGEAVVARVARFDEQLRDRVRVLSSLAAARLDAARILVSSRGAQLVASAHRQLDHRDRHLLNARTLVLKGLRRRIGEECRAVSARAEQLGRATRRRLVSDLGDLERCQQVLNAYDPARQLQRGWSLTHGSTGRLLRSVEEVTDGEVVTTRLADGQFSSVVATRATEGSDD